MAVGVVIVDNELAAIFQSDGVDPAVWVGEFGRFKRAPGIATVLRPAIHDLTLPAAAENLQTILSMSQNRRLDGAELFPVVERRGFGPGLAKVRSAFHVNAPAIELRARAAKDCAVRQLHGLILDRS